MKKLTLETMERIEDILWKTMKGIGILFVCLIGLFGLSMVGLILIDPSTDKMKVIIMAIVPTILILELIILKLWDDKKQQLREELED